MDLFLTFLQMINLLFLLILLLLIVGLIYLLRDDSDSKNMQMSKAQIIKTVYFYMVSLIALMMVVFSTADLINLGLKTWVFPKASLNEWREPPCSAMIIKDPMIDQTEEMYQQRIQQCEAGRMDEGEAIAIRNQQSAVRDISFLAVGIPLFLYHWITIRREKQTV